MAELRISELLKSVEVKNRVRDGRVAITYNSEQIIWEPGEIKRMPRAIAEWMVYLKSYYHLNPGEPDEGVPASREYKLCILGDGKDETDISREDVLAVKELLDAKNMPSLNRVDPQTGKLMRRVYIDPRSTGASDSAARMAEQQATKTVSSAIVRDAAEKIAEAAEGASEAEIVAAVEDLTGVSGSQE